MKDLSPALLIAAAGQGRRMGGDTKKPYLLLAGKPVLAHTLEVFLKLNLFSLVGVIIAPGEKEAFREWVLEPFFAGEERLFQVEGGEERQISVFNGLKSLQDKKVHEDALVCVHDGARPLVDESLILNVYREALITGAAIAGVPLKDTIKEIDSDHMVRKTPQRDLFMAVQTPQCFSFSVLWQAHCQAAEAGFFGSDDSSLVERLGINVKVVPGSYENLKLTTPSDLRIAEEYLSSRRFLK
ncbi:MAG: 2-C-methyl-D-erythritol 4-phosphate cytidylyltransferase [Bacillota bacterium]|nr:2-C-methyl-D-erythritol 4-phosphate cytidylyltransferase [Bacillota bacterium]